jgi:hypothetical protein
MAEQKEEEPDLLDQVIEDAKTHDVDNCDVDECFTCGYILCPNKSIEHLFHDGCPTCYFEEPSEPVKEEDQQN